MALTGLDVYKMLPKENCGKCGPPTCLAFAMQVASGKASPEKCPIISSEALEAIAAASAPPVRLVTIGTGDKAVKVGDETVLFRHEKTFVHPTAVFVRIPDNMPGGDEARWSRVKGVDALRFERVGQSYRLDGFALDYRSGDPQSFLSLVKMTAEASDLPVALLCDDPELAARAAEICSGRRPLLCANEKNLSDMVKVAKSNSCPMVVSGNGVEGATTLADKAASMGCADLVLDTMPSGLREAITDYTHIRRLSLKRKYRAAGYPIIAFTSSHDPVDEACEAASLISKYASILVVNGSSMPQTMAVITWRENLYSDPQKPIQVDARVYEIGHVDRGSPVYLTTNFSLTYFSVESEVQASRMPGYILPVDTDGTSVLTAWAAGKFTPEKAAGFLNTCGIESMIDHRKVIIPGYVSVISGKLKDLSGWDVIVGPQEASGIPSFVRSRWGLN